MMSSRRVVLSFFFFACLARSAIALSLSPKQWHETAAAAPSWPKGSAVAPRDDSARKLARLLAEIEVVARLVRWCLILGAGSMQWLVKAIGEASAPLVFSSVAVVELRGVIVDDRDAQYLTLHSGIPWCLDATMARAGDGLISVRRVDRALSRAFRCRRLRAVVLKISSPGGTASESALLYRRILMLKKKRIHSEEKHGPLTTFVRALTFIPRRLFSSSSSARPTASSSSSLLLPTPQSTMQKPEVVAYVDDLCTSGGYYAACAADTILAAPSAVIGSIGVVTRGFGYSKQIRKLGVERRILASGNAKAGIDPFLPIKPDAVARERAVLSELHNEFVETVKKHRGAKLKPLAAATLAAKADVHNWPFSLRSWIAVCPPLRLVFRTSRIERGDGIFDGSVHASRTALRIGLIDDVSENHFERTLKQRYGRGIRIKRFRVSPMHPRNLFWASSSLAAHGITEAPYLSQSIPIPQQHFSSPSSREEDLRYTHP